MKQIFAWVAALFLSISMAFAAVNVNTATQAELQTLEGIGPVRAKAIIDYRTKNGPFKSIDDLLKVPGIGENTLSSIRKDLTLTGPTTVSADAKGSAKSGDKKATKEEKGSKASAGEAKESKASKETKAKSDDKKADRVTEKSKSDEAKDKSKSAKKDEKKAEASK